VVGDVGSCNFGDYEFVSKTDARFDWKCLGLYNGSDQDCEFYYDQLNWFQVEGGNVLAGGSVTNLVPMTCGMNVIGEKYIACESITTPDGFILSKEGVTTSTYDSSSTTSDNDFTNLYYPYEELKAEYFYNKGIGTTFGADPSWSEVKNTTGVIFVDGNLTINSDLNGTNFVMIIAEGTITINQDVNEVDAILVANYVIASSEEGSGDVSPLTIEGIVHGVSGVEFSRSLEDSEADPTLQVINSNTPSVKVIYKPEWLFMIPDELIRAFKNWRIS